MKVSLNWIRFLNEKYHCAADPAPDGIEALVERIGRQLGAVEEVFNLGEKYEGIVVAKVVSVKKHPNADKLKICLVNDDGNVKNVTRDKNGLIEIVCGAPDVKAGQLAAWIPPGVAMPSTYDTEPFVIEKRDIRGVPSNGMLASAKELALGDDHEGILVIDPPAKPGQPLAETLGLNDYVIDIENKMFTHRPDCFGMLGVAREIAGIQRQVFKSPDWYKENADLHTDGRSNGLRLQVKNNVSKLVPRFCAVAIKNVKVGPSPLWLQVRLSSVGVRPVNNIVDITNFFMLETSQPLHAYDYDKLRTGVLGVRLSKKGEQLKLIGGKTIKLEAGAVVITDGHKPVGLGGVMGGADTEVDANTKNIILECANFDMNSTRKTARYYGLFTDAATRFTKNQSPRQNRAVIVKAANDLLKIAGGRVASKVIDETAHIAAVAAVKVEAAFINSRLGTDLPVVEMKKILENVEFKVQTGGDKLTIMAPFWRTDIEIPEDIVEEVGRLYGYDKLPIVLPRRDISPVRRDALLDFKTRLRDSLSRAGASEVLTYSFVHGSLMQKVGQDPQQAFRIANALSPDLQYYRLSLTPSLLEKVQPNLRGGFDEFALFEIGKGHNQKMKDKSGLPIEFEMLSLVIASRNKSVNSDGASYYQARLLLDYLATELGIELAYKPILKEEQYPVTKPFDHQRSAQVWDTGSDTPLGMVGEYKQSVMRNLKLPSYCAGFEIGVEQLLQAIQPHRQYRLINRFPELEQDLCLRTSTRQTYAQLTSFITDNLSQLSKPHGYQFKLKPLDIFQRQGDTAHKQTTWRIVLAHPERTLTTEETNILLNELAKAAKQKLKAERI